MPPFVLPLAISLLAAFALSSPVIAQSTVPPIFLMQSAEMQSQICGDLMAGIAVAGLKSVGGAATKEVEQLALVYDTAAQAILALERASGLTAEQKQATREIAQSIERLDAQPHIQTVIHCRRMTQGWLESGEIIPQAYEQALAQAETMLPQLIEPESALVR